MLRSLYHWGSTESERAGEFACDEYLRSPDCELFRAVSVKASPARVFRWLCQLRLAPYSYDWIDNLGRQSPRQLVEGTERLAVGQSVMLIFRLVAFEPDRQITIVTRPGLSRLAWLMGEVAVTYAALPDTERGTGGSRLVAKLVVRYPKGPVGWLMRCLLPAGDLVMMRRQLLNLKALAEA